MGKGNSSTTIMGNPKQQTAAASDHSAADNKAGMPISESSQCAREQSAPRAVGHLFQGSKQKSTPSKPVGKEPGKDLQHVPVTPAKTARRKGRPATSTVEPCQAEIGLESCTKNESFADAAGIPVEVIGMPTELCTSTHLDTIIRLAGLEGELVGHRFRQESTGAVAVIKLKTWDGAQRCYRHFDTCSWSTGALKVRIGLQRAPLVRQYDELEKWYEGTRAPAAPNSAPPTIATYGLPMLNSPPCVAIVFQPHTGWQSQRSNWHSDRMVAASFAATPDDREQIGHHNPELEEHFQHGHRLHDAQFQMSAVDHLLDAKLGIPRHIGLRDHRILQTSCSAHPMPYFADPMTHQKALARAQAHARG